MTDDTRIIEYYNNKNKNNERKFKGPGGCDFIIKNFPFIYPI